MSKDISLDFMLPVQEVERDGRSYRLEASEAELAALAERFNLIEFGSLKADIEVKDAARSRAFLSPARLTLPSPSAVSSRLSRSRKRCPHRLN